MRERSIAAALAIAALVPMQARALPPPPLVVFEAPMRICDGIDQWGCTYGTDVFWSDGTWMRQGLYRPTMGPPATDGPVRVARTAATCSSGPCEIQIDGRLGPRAFPDLGAYCDALQMELHGRVTGSGIDMEFDVTWVSPGGPVSGRAVDTFHPGTTRVSGHLVGRGAPTGGDCGTTSPLTSLVLEGVLVFG
jgi:hypothetical protein